MANELMRENWSGSGRAWVKNEQTFDAIFAPFTEAILQTAELRACDRMLDVGCGSGTLLERAVAIGASAVGVDISEAMAQAAAERVPQARVVHADAQTIDLRATVPGQPFDRVMSRFGVMFFEDPVAAFTNIRTATGPGAAMNFTCWREGDNPIFTLGTNILSERLEAPAMAADPFSPGPRAFGNADRVRAILAAAGWRNVAVEAFDGLCDHGLEGSDGVEERLAMIFASTTGRAARAVLEPQLSARGWAELVEEIRAELRRNLVDGVVRFVGRAWLVTATNPG